MTTRINGSDIVGKQFPPEEGVNLAKALLDGDTDWDDLTIDLRGLPASLLISAFFNGFLATINLKQPDLLSKAQNTVWEFDHDFQQENADRWISCFVAPE